jgi:hypothetical protein
MGYDYEVIETNNQMTINQNAKPFIAIAIGTAVGFSIVGTIGALGVASKAKVDNGLMTNVPGFGSSRVETVSFCLTDANVTRYQDLITDTQVEVFGACMKENT